MIICTIYGLSFQFEGCSPTRILPIHVELLNRHIAQLAREHFNRKAPTQSELEQFISTISFTKSTRTGYIESLTNALAVEHENPEEAAQERLLKQTKVALLGLL